MANSSLYLILDCFLNFSKYLLCLLQINCALGQIMYWEILLKEPPKRIFYVLLIVSFETTFKSLVSISIKYFFSVFNSPGLHTSLQKRYMKKIWKTFNSILKSTNISNLKTFLKHLSKTLKHFEWSENENINIFSSIFLPLT